MSVVGAFLLVGYVLLIAVTYGDWIAMTFIWLWRLSAELSFYALRRFRRRFGLPPVDRATARAPQVVATVVVVCAASASLFYFLRWAVGEFS